MYEHSSYAALEILLPCPSPNTHLPRARFSLQNTNAEQQMIFRKLDKKKAITRQKGTRQTAVASFLISSRLKIPLHRLPLAVFPVLYTMSFAHIRN